MPDIQQVGPRGNGRMPPIKLGMNVDWYGVCANFVKNTTTSTSTLWQEIDFHCSEEQPCDGSPLSLHNPPTKYFSDTLKQVITALRSESKSASALKVRLIGFPMKKLMIGVGVAILLAVSWLLVRSAPVVNAACSTEEIRRAVAPDKNMTAIYENAICLARPEVLEARVLLVSGVAESRTSWRVVFRAATAVDRQLSRPTQVEKLRLSWVDSSTLSIETAADLKIDSSPDTADLNLRLIVDGRSESPKRESGQGKADDMQVLMAHLKSDDEDRIRNEAFTLLYNNFGREEFWPIISALWTRGDVQFPDFNWRVLNDPSIRLRAAGLWGQWSREVRKDRSAAETAAAYARSLIGSNLEQIRLEAISTLGSVGSDADRSALAAIVLGEDERPAIRAVTAIVAIERASGIRKSMLPRLAEQVKNQELKMKILEVNDMARAKRP